jgi:hypothetical protein
MVVVLPAPRKPPTITNRGAWEVDGAAATEAVAGVGGADVGGVGGAGAVPAFVESTVTEIPL